MPTPVAKTPVLGKVLKLASMSANVGQQLVIPTGARWLTVWECSDDEARVYVVDEASALVDAAGPTQRRKVSSYPMAIDIRGWRDLWLVTDAACDLYVEVTASAEDRCV